MIDFPAWLDPPLLRRVGRGLLAAFGVLLLAGLVPFTPGELDWSVRLSGVIVDTSSLPLVGLLLLRAAGPRLASASPDPLQRAELSPQAEPEDPAEPPASVEPERHDRGPDLPAPAAGLGLARLGSIALLLLALWQIPLWFAGLDRIDAEFSRADLQLQARIARSEQQLSQAGAEQIRRNWQELEASMPVGLRQNGSDPADQRLLLQQRLRTNAAGARKQLRLSSQQARFSLARERLRVLLLAVIYGWALRGLSRWVLP